jgi:hypothetical protein
MSSPLPEVRQQRLECGKEEASRICGEGMKEESSTVMARYIEIACIGNCELTKELPGHFKLNRSQSSQRMKNLNSNRGQALLHTQGTL